MNDHVLVEALRSRDSGASAAVYDAYADRLYAYCWFHLRSRDAAQVALRDTMIVAEAHIGKLRDPDRFGPWLYAIARLECARRVPSSGERPDVPVATHDQEDVDQRVMAWRAVLGMPPASREMLELRVRHQLSVPDLALVFGLQVKDAQAALDHAHTELESALTAELLAHQNPYACAERAAILRERRGELTVRLRHALLRHARECEVCGSLRPRTVSPAKVYGLLPQAVPPESLRLRVMSCFLDPELVGYRLFVATRISGFSPAGFPLPERPAMSPRRPRRPSGEHASDQPGAPAGPAARRRRRHGRQAGAGWARPVIGAVAAAAVGLVLVAIQLVWLSGVGDRTAHNTASGVTPRVQPSVPPTGTPPMELGPDAKATEGLPASATFPLGARISTAPPMAVPLPGKHYQTKPNGPEVPGEPGGPGRLLVAPLYLDLGGGARGGIELQAQGGPLTWRARTTGPIRLSQSAGRLAAGQSAILSVRAFRKATSQGQGAITFQPGGVVVTVTWRPGHPGPGPGPGPGPTPTQTPTPTPTGTKPSSPPGRPTTATPTDPPATSMPPEKDPEKDPENDPEKDPETKPPSEDPPPASTPAPQPPASSGPSPGASPSGG